jgi:predicted short-subunit dehydrogenase-like oxidoreductase (DUF2520 family)
MKKTQWHAAIIGAGKVGSTLGKVLAENGHRVDCIISRTTKSARAAGRFIGCTNVSTDLSAIPRSVNLILITTPHGAVEEVARNLAGLGRSFRGVAVCHASGMLTAAALDPLKRKGATVFSFHPLQTFPRSFPPKRILPHVRHIPYGVDGSRAGILAARRLAAALQGTVFLVPPHMRVFYHAACVVASNHLTTLLWILDTMYRTMDRRGRDFLGLFAPIITASLDNARMASPGEALTGPIARGGVETVARHLEALEQSAPETIRVYAALSLETVRLAASRGALTRAQQDELRRLLERYTTTEEQQQGHS